MLNELDFPGEKFFLISLLGFQVLTVMFVGLRPLFCWSLMRGSSLLQKSIHMLSEGHFHLKNSNTSGPAMSLPSASTNTEVPLGLMK